MKKHLKKAVLCAVLCLLLSGIGSALAAFTDGNLITYKTPVGVMHGAGILSGYADGTFNPTGSITREEAVKMVTFAVLGEQGVAELPKSAPCFADISEGSWSAPYVCWAVKNGIISGRGDGTFEPTGNVTGYQLAKMMLCAAGYGQKGEYSGSSWESTVAKDGFAKGIFANITNADPSRSVTREEAALYIFNGITRVEQVSFDEGEKKYVPRDGTAQLDNTIASQVYGIAETGSSKSVFRGVLTENLASGGTDTIVDGQSFDYITGAELLGHQVAVFTNGEEGLKNRIYYISDECETVTLRFGISSQKQFIEAFSDSPKLSADLLVYDKTAVLTDKTEIDGLSVETYSAPAGSYVFSGGELISYMPLIDQYAALISFVTGENAVLIAGERYEVQSVVGLDYCKNGDVVQVKTLSGRTFVSPAKSYTARLERIDKDSDGNDIYFFKNVAFSKSSIENKTGVEPVDPQPGKYYTLFYDDNYKYITVVDGQI